MRMNGYGRSARRSAHGLASYYMYSSQCKDILLLQTAHARRSQQQWQRLQRQLTTCGHNCVPSRQSAMLPRQGAPPQLPRLPRSLQRRLSAAARAAAQRRQRQMRPNGPSRPSACRRPGWSSPTPRRAFQFKRYLQYAAGTLQCHAGSKHGTAAHPCYMLHVGTHDPTHGSSRKKCMCRRVVFALHRCANHTPTHAGASSCTQPLPPLLDAGPAFLMELTLVGMATRR